MTILPVFVIGQAPRPDLAAEIAAATPGLSIVMRGALDGLSRAEIDALTPRDDADTLFTILPDGAAVSISKAAVTARMRTMLGSVAGAVLLACTGAFKGLPERPGLVQPSSVLNGLAGALLPRGRLGLFVPLPEQAEALGGSRARDGLSIIVHALRPHSDAATRAAAMAAMAQEKPDLLVLDCISYTRADKVAAVAVMDCPVLLSVAVAAHAAACLLPEA